MYSFYGISISLGIFLALTVSEKAFPKLKKDIWGSALYAVLFGITGARLYHVIDFAHYYLQNPMHVFYLWQGGLGIWGGVIDGLLGIWLYSKRHKLSFLELSNALSFSAPLAQAVGRFGNFFNMELLGIPTKLPWAIQGRHPVFFYEAGLNLMLFCFFLFFKKTQRSNKFFLGAYLIGYGTIRFFMEFLKENPWTINGLNVAQMVSILSLLIGLIILTQRKKNL